jgi:hypothetical protein
MTDMIFPSHDRLIDLHRYDPGPSVRSSLFLSYPREWREVKEQRHKSRVPGCRFQVSGYNPDQTMKSSSPNSELNYSELILLAYKMKEGYNNLIFQKRGGWTWNWQEKESLF